MYMWVICKGGRITMIKLIGKKDCNRCQMTKSILENRNIKFEYILFDDLSNDDKTKYLNMAQENNMIELPLILKDECLITLQEI